MKLWQTKYPLDTLIERFTVWADPTIDLHFINYDITASRAHVSMLKKMRIITLEECALLEKWFSEISELLEKWEFQIRMEDEDCHTAIESYITEHYGKVWKKIHTGRSRNDQSLTMMRLYLRDSVENAIQILEKLLWAFEQKMKNNSIVMPGYTHWQKAMPTDTNTWLGSFHDAIRDQMQFFHTCKNILDQSPLGSAAGFGIDSFDNDRVYSSKLMGFTKVQENPMYCWLSRGLIEHNILSGMGSILMILSRLNNDILLFTTSEFSFMKLPNNMTTGSSIMPQKRNYDVCELVRAKISIFFGYADQMRNMYTHLMSGYQRDLQMTKSVLLHATTTWMDIVEVYTYIINALEFQCENLERSITPDLLLTDEVYKVVNTGVSFRDAYKQVKATYFENENIS
jgi:argininosuccinate lyase